MSSDVDDISEVPEEALGDAPVDAYRDEVMDAADNLADYQSAARVVSDVQDTYIERCIEADGMSSTDEAFALAHVLVESAVEIADDADDRSIPLVLDEYTEYVETYSGEIAQAASTRKEIVAEPLLAQLRAATSNARNIVDEDDLVDEDEVEAGKEGIESGIDGVGMGVDRYIEEHLDQVLIESTTDHTNDETVVFEFDDGKTLDLKEAKYHSFGEFYRELGDGNEVTVRRVIESQAATEHIDGDVTDENDKKPEYRLASLGPRERPWHEDGDMWDEAMKHLISNESEYYVDANPIPGPRMDAIEDIMSAVASQQASRDKHNASENGAVYVDESEDELWVPYQIVDKAVEDVAASREDVVYELSARGMTASGLSGDRVSKWIVDDRYWVFDLDHDRVAEPDEIVDELKTGTGAMLDGLDGGESEATADGGTKFGQDDGEENTGDDDE